MSAQSAFALVIGAYAAHRGFKALLAGLNLIHDETEPHGFFKFNLLAFFVALVAFALFTVVSGAVVTSRLLEHAGRSPPDGRAPGGSPLRRPVAGAGPRDRPDAALPLRHVAPDAGGLGAVDRGRRWWRR